MFKKPKRNFRGNRRNLDDDDNEPSQVESAHIVNKPQSFKPEVKIDRSSKSERKILSFHDEIEEESEVFKIKKSSHSKKVARRIKEQTKKEREKVRPSDDVRATPKSEPLARPSSPAALDSPPDEYSESRLKKLREEFLVLNGDDAAAMDTEEEETSGVASLLKRGVIPDATTIHLAKKQRELAKQRGAAAEAEAEAEAGAAPGEEVRPRVANTTSTSRLVREDDDDISSEEEGGHEFSTSATVIGPTGAARRGLSFGTARNKKERELQLLREQFLAAEQGSGDEDEAVAVASRQWEKQQLGKALAGPPGNADSAEEQFESEGIGGLVPFPSLASKLAPGDITVDSLKHALDAHIASLEAVHSGHRQELEKAKKALLDSEEALSNAQRSLPKLEQDSRFFQELEAYTTDLIQCLDEKVPKLEYLEKRTLDLAKQHCTRLTARRRRDIEDETLEVAASIGPAAVPSGDAKEEEARKKRSAEREARRMRRRRVRESKKIFHHNEGMSSDDEVSSADMMKISAEKEAIETDCGALFDDVMEQFSDLELILERYVRWRDLYADSYSEAYMARCLPKLVGPIVRLQLVTWNPLASSAIAVDRTAWFSTLMTASCSALADSSEQSNGECSSVAYPDDLKIVPSVIERTVVPRLREFVAEAWDPLSSSQTSRLVNLLQALVSDYPTICTESKEVRRLLEAAVLRMRASLDHDIFIPLYPKTAVQNSLSAPALYLHRQFWSSVKLLGNILAWSDLLSDLLLQSLAIDLLLSRYVIVALIASEPSPDFLHKIVAVHSTFPRAWFDSADACPACLHNFARFVEKMAIMHFSKDRETMSQLARILDKMKAAGNAAAITEALK